jgi:hypothetical protein
MLVSCNQLSASKSHLLARSFFAEHLSESVTAYVLLPPFAIRYLGGRPYRAKRALSNHFIVSYFTTFNASAGSNERRQAISAKDEEAKIGSSVGRRFVWVLHGHLTIYCAIMHNSI